MLETTDERWMWINAFMGSWGIREKMRTFLTHIM